MFIILAILFVGIGLGWCLRNRTWVAHVQKSINITIYLMLFTLGTLIGSNRSVLENLPQFGGEALLIALLGILGSILASMIALHLYLKNKRQDEE